MPRGMYVRSEATREKMSLRMMGNSNRKNKLAALPHNILETNVESGDKTIIDIPIPSQPYQSQSQWLVTATRIGVVKLELLKPCIRLNEEDITVLTKALKDTLAMSYRIATKFHVDEPRLVQLSAGEKSEGVILQYLSTHPKSSTSGLLVGLKDYGYKIHFYPLKKILEKLENDGKVISMKLPRRYGKQPIGYTVVDKNGQENEKIHKADGI